MFLIKNWQHFKTQPCLKKTSYCPLTQVQFWRWRMARWPCALFYFHFIQHQKNHSIWLVSFIKSSSSQLVLVPLRFPEESQCSSIKEGKEVMDEPEGRWFPFSVTNTAFVILEKKHLPQHLTSIESLESPVTLQSLVNDLQDAGEVARIKFWNLYLGTGNGCGFLRFLMKYHHHTNLESSMWSRYAKYRIHATWSPVLNVYAFHMFDEYYLFYALNIYKV